ncbi:MAG: hypothetical protein C5S49_00375 [Candidatus Methanogaster sp.]|nr:MAG: hypothetical protein C5S49_00375 [ANME-2 cluster archaeon]
MFLSAKYKTSEKLSLFCKGWRSRSIDAGQKHRIVKEMNRIISIILFLALASRSAQNIPGVSRECSVASMDAPRILQMAEVPT